MKCPKCGKLMHRSVGVVLHMMPSYRGRLKDADANIFWCKDDECKEPGRQNRTIYNRCKICNILYDTEQPDRVQGEPHCPKCREIIRAIEPITA